MGEPWRKIALGEVFELHNAKLGRHSEEPPVVSLSKHDGIVLAEDYFDKRIASERLDGYKVVPPDGWAYSTIHIDEGSIARNKLGHTAVLSPMYTTMTFVARDQDPEFFELLLRSPTMLTAYKDSARGSVNRRRSLPFTTFASLRVSVPPPSGQRRIVHLLRSVRATLEATRRVESTAQQAGVAVIGDRVSIEACENVAVDELLSHVIGGAWGDAAGQSEIDVVALGPSVFADDPIIIDAGRGTRRSLPDARRRTRALQHQDIVLERSGGTTEQPVGRVVYASRDMDDVVPSDFMRLLRVDPSRAEPSYVYWALWHRYQTGGSVAFQSQTTNIRNLRVPDYLAHPIPLPARAAQVLIAELADELAAVRMRARKLAKQLENLHVALLSDLLADGTEIPASYDPLIATS